MGAVKPSVRPCVEGRSEDECGECDALGGYAEDEESGEDVHGEVSLLRVCNSLPFPVQLLRPGGRSPRASRAGHFLWGLPRPERGGYKTPA